MKSYKYVIIGNSAAAIGAVESIRKTDTSGSVAIISNEPHHTYSRPLISYLLLGKTDEQHMKYRADNFYEANGITPILGVSAEKIDSGKHTVSLSDGEIIGYEKLLVATGSTPFVPPMNGLDSVDSSKKFTFATLDDAHALSKAITSDSRVLIIGAGLIGLKCAEGILHSVKEITVVDLAPKVLSSILDDGGAAFIKSRLESAGLKFYLGDSVDVFTNGEAKLKSGAVVGFDILVLAVGVRANVSLVKDAGGNVGRGITVNERLETSLPDIYAAGDCTESVDISSGDVKIMALLPNAYLQGECAGANMTGADKTFDKAFPMNAIGFFGTHIVTAGTYAGEVYTEEDAHKYRRLFYHDNKLSGFILIGDETNHAAFERAGIYANLIREKTPLDSIDFELIKSTPALIAFSKTDRARKLAGVKESELSLQF
ncbi:pyridine nucleotide-disulfide oxidoreductase [Clostridia bacterium]|nr:pyridine nucleotide-disulfide oxidoreductase [Clostridia bacterium]